ncbi:MAG: excinuclease ABC subunit UvrB [bacterium]
MKFELEAQFKPTGDQPQAIEELTIRFNDGVKHQTLLGVTGSGKTFTMANVINNIQRPTLVISHNKTLAAQLASEFREFFPNNAVHYFVSYYDYYQPEAYIPRTDTYIEKEVDINEEIDRLRHAATHSLATRKDVVIVASVSCIYGLGHPDDYNKLKVELKKGMSVPREEIVKGLVNIRYNRNDIDFHRGTFRVRGDVLDIFPADAENMIRAEFFGDDLERILELDPLTGEVLRELEEEFIFPATHFATTDDKLKKSTSIISKDLAERIKELKKDNKLIEAQRIEQRTNYDLEMIEEIGFCNGIENYSRYFDDRKPGQPPFTLIDYFPKDFAMFIDESHMTIPQIRGMYFGDRARKENLVDHGFRLPSAMDNRPLNFAEFAKRVNQASYVSATPGPYELKKSGIKSGLIKDAFAKKDVRANVSEQIIRPTGLIDPEIEIRPSKNQIDDLLEEIKKRTAKKQRVLVTTLTKRMAEDLAEYLKEAGIKGHYLHSEVDTFERLETLRDLRTGKYDVVVGINLLREGLDLPEVSLVAIIDADKEGFLRSETSLIQIMGRTARHVEGQVIMYADKTTRSMKNAISETRRRRKIQKQYNEKHGITPKTIEKAITNERLAGAKTSADRTVADLPTKEIPQEELPRLIKDLEQQMELAAKNLEFEKAAELRDQIGEIKEANKKNRKLGN